MRPNVEEENAAVKLRNELKELGGCSETGAFITCNTLFDAESITTSFTPCHPRTHVRCEVLGMNGRLKEG